MLWKELQIETPGELLYACNENRLVELKGFGLKTQDHIRNNINYLLSKKGHFHFAFAEKAAQDFSKYLFEKNPDIHLTLSGTVRRKCETIEAISFIAPQKCKNTLLQELASPEQHLYQLLSDQDNRLQLSGPSGIAIQILFYPENQESYFLWKTTGHEDHLTKCLTQANIKEPVLIESESEEALYTKLGLPFIEPELREGLDEIQRALQGRLPEHLISLQELKGILHNHSTWSDGIHSLKEMAQACKDQGYEYLGISDHSRSAQYAGGLSIERVLQQQEEIKMLNAQMAPFRIFSGIESDILADGSLDYPDEILQSFDFIVASVHSGLRMDKEKATQRLLKAIRNPYTTILGHPSGRLLLSREGYPLDYEEILKACAEEKVVVEVNAHPYRLDLDWRWIACALDLGVQLSINPDAHSIAGFGDMYYGVCVARKGYLTKAQTFNALSRKEISDWLSMKKARG